VRRGVRSCSDRAPTGAARPQDSLRIQALGGCPPGLTLGRELVAAHGGRLSLANRPGGGVRVTLRLP
jgi:signal transduction histidine kinase